MIISMLFSPPLSTLYTFVISYIIQSFLHCNKWICRLQISFGRFIHITAPKYTH